LTTFISLTLFYFQEEDKLLKQIPPKKGPWSGPR